MAVLIRMMMLLMILMYHDDINATDDKCNGNSSTRDNIDVTYDFDCNGNWWYTNDVAVVLIICFSSGVIICFYLTNL